MAKVDLPKISSLSFEHPADRAALESLKKTVGFDRLMRTVAKVGADQWWRVMNESCNIRLGPRQVGSVWDIHCEVAKRLDLDPVPPLYLQHDVRLNAMTAGVEEPFVIVTSGLIEGMNDDEIACVLGHEMGHILAGHVLYKMVAGSLGSILQTVGDLTLLGPLVRLTLVAALQYWSRCAELTSDRAGLLAVQDPQVALTVEMKLGAGTGSRIARELSLDAFMQQVREFKESDAGKLEGIWRVLLEFERSHPWPVVRAHELDKWVQDGSYAKILAGDYQRRASSLVGGSPRGAAPADPTSELAAGAEDAIADALSRTYGVHVAPRIPQDPLGLALGAYVENLEHGERVIALYDATLSGHGDKGVLLTDRRAFSSARPRAGVWWRDVRSVRRTGGGLLTGPGLELEGLELRFHTRAVREAFLNAAVGAVKSFRGEPPQVE